MEYLSFKSWSFRVRNNFEGLRQGSKIYIIPGVMWHKWLNQTRRYKQQGAPGAMRDFRGTRIQKFYRTLFLPHSSTGWFSCLFVDFPMFQIMNVLFQYDDLTTDREWYLPKDRQLVRSRAWHCESQCGRLSRTLPWWYLNGKAGAPWFKLGIKIFFLTH